MTIRYWNRKAGTLETEDVYGDLFVRLLYGNPLGFALADHLLARKFLSRFYGSLQSSSRSARKIEKFISRFHVPMEQYAEGPFSSFNDFFIRKFKPGLRPFPEDSTVLGAPAEARYLAFSDSSVPLTLPIKGLQLDPLALLGNTPQKEAFRRGPCLLARLCPVDYHRFHFPDSGMITHQHMETGKLHSVNPLALKRHPSLFLTNERHISLLKTENFGLIAYVEVGALCVGKIVQSHSPGLPFKRSDEKGYFLFGGSTVVIYGEQGAWIPESDLLEHSTKGVESLVQLGEPVARAGRHS